MAGLPWIKLSVDVVSHPKSLDLAERLGDPDAWRFPVRLWLWVASHAGDGVLEGLRGRPAAIEGAAGWPGKRGELLGALVASGFLDPLPPGREGFEVHGWEEHAGAHRARMEHDRQRAAIRRAKERAAAGLAPEPLDAPLPPPGDAWGESADSPGTSSDGPRTSAGRRVDPLPRLGRSLSGGG